MVQKKLKPLPPGKTLHGEVLAIDTGSYQSGWIVWDGSKLLDGGIDSNEEMLNIIGKYATQGSCGMAIEQVMSHGRAMGQSVIDTAYWEGRFVQEYQALSNVEALRIGRVAVRKFICYHGLAKDSEITRRLKDRFGEKPTKKNPNPVHGEVKLKDDMWQAWALGLTAMGVEL